MRETAIDPGRRRSADQNPPGASHDLAVGPALAQTVPKRPDTVGVSAVLVEMTPGRSTRILPSVPDGVVVVAKGFRSEDGTSSASGLLREAGGVLHENTDFAGGGGGVAAMATSPVVIAEDMTERGVVCIR